MAKSKKATTTTKNIKSIKTKSTQVTAIKKTSKPVAKKKVKAQKVLATTKAVAGLKATAGAKASASKKKSASLKATAPKKTSSSKKASSTPQRGSMKKTNSAPKVKAITKASPASKSTSATESNSTAKTVSQAAGADQILGKLVGGLTLPMTGGKVFDLKTYAGKKVILYFYPKDMTPGCTVEGHEFTSLAPEFKKMNTVVLGVSRDSIDLHEKFIKKENFAVDLLSDTDEKACRWFDVIKEKNMYGKKVMGIERSTFLIGEDGKVLHAWRKVKAEGHAAEVLDFVKSHTEG